MASANLLSLVQIVLSSIDGDEVTTISQTVESQQVALIIQNCYNDIIDRAELKKTKQLFQLTPSGITQPTLMTLPSVTQTVINTDWIQYDKRLSTAPTGVTVFTGYISGTTLTVVTIESVSSAEEEIDDYDFVGSPENLTLGSIIYGGTLTDAGNLTHVPTTLGTQLTGNAGGVGTYTVSYSQTVGSSGSPATFTETYPVPDWEYISFLPIDQFLMLTNSYDVSEGDVMSYPYTNPNGQTFNIVCKNDIAPTWWTTLDDNTFLFDSFDNAIDTTGLVSAKMMAYGQLGVVFSLTDTYTPFLEDHQFSLLLQNSIARAWVELKQQANPKAEQSERRQWIHLQKARRTSPTHRPAIADLPDYGRRGGWRQDWGADNMLYWMRKGK